MATDDEQTAERTARLDAILSSEAPRKLIVAGPGTGKTHTFRVLLARTTPNLALTFINTLASDLRDALGDAAETYTFHGFCKRLLYESPSAGMSPDVDYYPRLIALQVDDLVRLEAVDADEARIERAFHLLDDSDPCVGGALRSGAYYNAVGHLDSVYRMFRHFESTGDIPSYAQVVVDEFQDFSLLEVRFIRQLEKASPILVVGDDDQALYGFKHASADHIRELAGGEDYTRFELPYCSRCTEVLVAATHTVISHARARGLLAGRVDKRYECFLASKRDDSLLHPKIIHARCSVQTAKAPYMGRYIRQRIEAIPPADVEESRRDRHPTVLVVGPGQFVAPVVEYLRPFFPTIQHKARVEDEVAILDGYLRIARDSRSRLGWRIVMYVDPPHGAVDLLRLAVIDGAELVDVLPKDFVAHHLAIVGTIVKLRGGQPVTDAELDSAMVATGLAFEELVSALGRGDDDPVGTRTDAPTDGATPTITATTLVGCKGLQASHVFVVGLNHGHFPRDNAAIEDDEVCKLLVALTRATKSCTVLSTFRFGAASVKPSIFLDWIRPHLETVVVDRDYFAR